MAEDHLKIWETLFQRALVLIDSVSDSGTILEDWNFGWTVLMRRDRHRFSKDIDIFVTDPQFLGYLTPRLNTKAESLTAHYIEQAGFLKLSFPEGEIDFVASAPLTTDPTIAETLFGRRVQVETSTEIIAKKTWHRGDQFTARDVFDLALVAENSRKPFQRLSPFSVIAEIEFLNESPLAKPSCGRSSRRWRSWSITGASTNVWSWLRVR